MAKAYRLSLPAPDGHTVARVGSDRLWFEDARTGRRTTRDADFRWSPDARWLLSSGGDGFLRLWDAARGALAARTVYEPSGVLAAFSPDSDKVYVWGSDSTLRTQDRASLRPAYDDVEFGTHLTALLPHPTDDSAIVLMIDGSFARVHLETAEFLSREPPGLLATQDQAGALSPDGSRMAAPDVNFKLRLLDLESLEWVGSDSQTLLGNDLVYAPDGSQFAMLQPERIRLWNGRTGEYQASLPLPSRTAHLSISYLPARQHGSSHRSHRREDVGCGHPHEHMGATRLQDSRPQPHAGRVEAVLRQPTLRDHLPAAAHGHLNRISRRDKSPVPR